mmetsp:Transcript_107909/g.310966  ORF Transcript_107909/g.310966 Transcript_107909/m.310966 type:complete len:436 (-) Transcript_107909:93-1400(-)
MEAARTQADASGASGKPARSLGGSAAARRRKQAVNAKNPQSFDKFKKTVMCRFFPKCHKGSECPFAHAEDEIRARPDLTKTRMCAGFYDGRCKLSTAECPFAHGEQELRVRQEVGDQDMNDDATASSSASTGIQGGTPTEASSQDCDDARAVSFADASSEAPSTPKCGGIPVSEADISFDSQQSSTPTNRGCPVAEAKASAESPYPSTPTRRSFRVVEADGFFLDGQQPLTPPLVPFHGLEAGFPFDGQQPSAAMRARSMAMEGHAGMKPPGQFVHREFLTLKAEPTSLDKIIALPFANSAMAPEASPCHSWQFSGSTRSALSASHFGDNSSVASYPDSSDEEVLGTVPPPHVDGAALAFAARRGRLGGAGGGWEMSGCIRAAAAMSTIPDGPVRDFMAKCLAHITPSGDGFLATPTAADIQEALLRAMPDCYED